ncbi:uncharacterized protein LOC120091681 isoform X2 [Benincasa hispida]|nr:uncharacterized protein LOC120091681 isoform X2 [Benincasa hispida]XP_038905718.1 uncharacterized protein LOC120091681 isoform X2 [Benincasa hispida]XP_038905719.1 uncharacterized protein LOC120091681 isoform X2 [Benincasa hispida]XP_038905720.1 uncharacterized protein LOC120091681 isoform X2 [Benincasa hispida]
MSCHNHGDEGDVELPANKEDDVVDEDMEVLQRAYRLVGVNPEDYINPRLSSPAVGDANSGFDSDDDDFELLRNIQNRFSIVDDEQPLSTLPPVSLDEEEDEFEMLRSIQRRFAAYESDVLSNKPNESRDYVGSLKMDSHNTAAESQTSSKRPSMVAFEKGSLPKAALAFVDAIKKNRSQQKFIRSKMIHLEARIEENKKLRKRCKILKDFQGSCKRKTTCALSQMIDPRVQLISAAKPQAKDSSKKDKRLSGMYYGPAENSHVACYRMALAKFPRVDRKKWSIVERENLGKGIRQQFQEMVLQISVDQISGLQGFSADSDDLDNILASIKDLDITPEKIREFLPKVNWDKLASMYLHGRSGAECEARWLNFEDPLINRDPWTTSEDKNLLFTIQQKGLNNWIEIAVSSGTNRTPFQCLSRYQRSLNASILKREWTKDEDDKLRSAVAIFGVRDWQAVASTLEGRAGTQCSNRWKKSLDPARTKRGHFTPDEDNRLKIAVLLLGPKNWNKKAEFLPGRNQVQCRERWFNCLDPSLRRCEWTEEEDLRLEIAIQEHGYSWAKVAACVPSRTDNDCRRRWKKLFPNEVPLLQEARKIQKAALISNFVDRESERPALGPADFRPRLNTDILCHTDDPKPAPKRNAKTRKMPVSRNEKSATGDAPRKRKSNYQRNQADATARVGIANNTSSVPEEVQSLKPPRKRNRHEACTVKRTGVLELHSNKWCAKQNLNTRSVGVQLSSKECEMTNSDFTETVDGNGLEVFENKIADKLSERDVFFSEPEENQNSTGSSGVSVLSEMTNDMDEYNPSILPDTTLLASTTVDDIEELKGKSGADRDLDDSNSFSLPLSCLELRTIDGEGVDSYSVDKSTDKSHEVCKQPQGRRKKNSKTSHKNHNYSFLSCQQVEQERLGMNEPRHRNQSKKRKHSSTNTSLLGTLEAVEEVDNCTLVGFLQKRLKKVDCSSGTPLEVDNDDNDRIASFLNKLKRKKHQPPSDG